MASRGEQTRDRILDAAERLFGDRGVRTVSLSEIRIAAGQRNERAVQYHFTDRAGLLQALHERHGPRIQEIQDRILARNGSRPSLRRQVEAWVRPIPEYGTRGVSERAWVKILPEVVADPRMSAETLTEVQSGAAIGAAMAVYERLCADLPRRLAGDRVWGVAQFVLHMSADRARLRDDPKAARALCPDDDFVDDLMAMAYGALVARPSAR